MKTLIIVAGLPGVGKSHICRILAKKIKKVLYFDSDLFSKKYEEKHRLHFTELSKKKQEITRLVFHRAKIAKIKLFFKKYDTILLDTCFDMIKSRKLFYRFAGKNKIKLVVVEVVCPANIVKQRILGKKHESSRMPGTKQDRWNFYKSSKSKWKPIKIPHFVIHSDKPLAMQIARFLSQNCL